MQNIFHMPYMEKEMNFQDFKAKLCQLTRRKQEHYKQSQRGGRTGGR